MNVYADKCDSQTKSDLLKEANLIKVDYDENEKTGNWFSGCGHDAFCE